MPCSSPLHGVNSKFFFLKKIAVGRQLRSVLFVNPNNLKIKKIGDDEFKERRRKDKEKQSKCYDQHTKEIRS